MFPSGTLLDGGFSTALEELGHSLNTPLWTAQLLKSQHDQIRQAHQLFVQSGADVVISSSYQLSYEGCAAQGWTASEVDEALEASVELARFPNVKVAASVGPYGAYLADGSEYRGNYGLSIEELKDFHRPRLRRLLKAEPDFFAVETIPELREARALIELLAELDPDIPSWISFSCKSGTEISSGESFAEVAELASRSPHIGAVGINCTSAHFVPQLLRSVDIDIPVIVYPNAGRTWDAESKVWIGSNEEAFSASNVSDWMSQGAVAVGGCCGVGPQDIARLRLLVDYAE